MYAEVLGVLDLAVEQVPAVQVTLNQAALVDYFIFIFIPFIDKTKKSHLG